MTSFILVLPLQCIIFPGEIIWVDMDITMSAQIDLLKDAYTQQKKIGVMPVLGDRLQETGCTATILEWVEDGAVLKARLEGSEIIRLLAAPHTVPDKSYTGGIVAYPFNEMNTALYETTKLDQALQKLYQQLGLSATKAASSYEIAHKIGFTIAEKYELLNLLKEVQRQEYIRRFLLQRMQQSVTADWKKGIQLN